MKALLFLVLVAGCGGSDDPVDGSWTNHTNPYGSAAAYTSSLHFSDDDTVTAHVVSTDFAPPGCTVTTDISGTFAEGEGTITFTWTAGTDVYAGCTDPGNDKTAAYDQAKLTMVSGTATFTVVDDQLTVMQMFAGTTFTQVYLRD